jgi:hypothetical protein
MDSHTVCKYFKLLEDINGKLTNDANNVKNQTNWKNLRKYVNSDELSALSALPELLNFWKKNTGNGTLTLNHMMNRFKDQSTMKLLKELKTHFVDDFYSILNEYFPEEINHYVELVHLVPKDIIELFMRFEHKNTRIEKKDWNIPEQMKFKAVEVCKYSDDRYSSSNNNYDLIITFEQKTADSFTNFVRNTGDTKSPEPSYGFNQTTFNEVYNDIFDRQFPLFIYKRKRFIYNSPLEPVKDVDTKYKELFRVLTEDNTLFENKSTDPSYDMFKDNLIVKRAVNFIIIAGGDYATHLFTTTDSTNGVFRKFFKDEHLTSLSTITPGFLLSVSGFRGEHNIIGQNMTSQMKTIYKQFLSENITDIESFDYDESVKNHDNRCPPMKIIDFDNAKGYGITFYSLFIPTNNGNKFVGFCLQLVTLSNIFDPDDTEIDVDVKLLIVWSVIKPEILERTTSSQEFIDEVMKPIQASLIDREHLLVDSVLEQVQEVVVSSTKLKSELLTSVNPDLPTSVNPDLPTSVLSKVQEVVLSSI